MALLIIGIPFVLLGLTMMFRGWAYTVKPDGAMANKRKKVNLKRGMTTDMKIFGRKVRRTGLVVTLVGIVLVGWHQSHDEEAASSSTAAAASPTG